MRYEPVKLREVTRVEYKKLEPGERPVKHWRNGIPATQRRPDGLYGLTGVEKRFWQVRSKVLGNCGHEHRTEAAAKPCLRRMKKEWSAKRSEQSKRTALKLKKDKLLYNLNWEQRCNSKK